MALPNNPSFSIRVEVVQTPWDDAKAVKDVRNAAKVVVQDYTNQALILAQTLAPVRTGALREGIQSKFLLGGLVGEVSINPSVSYAKYVIRGTKPHVIEAKNGLALRFFPKGSKKAVFRKRVNHPGTKPNPFMDKARERISPAYIQGMNDAMRKV